MIREVDGTEWETACVAYGGIDRERMGSSCCDGV